MKKIVALIMAIILAVALASCTNKTDETPAAVSLKFSELYAGSTVRGLQFSDTLKDLAGKPVKMQGFMAPPLKPALDFFVLTAQPMSICPFCDSDASWPSDIVLIYVEGGGIIATTQPLEVTGRLEIGSHTDENTGFVSQIRIYADKVAPIS
jgi:opacity protein-like surface antigen